MPIPFPDISDGGLYRTRKPESSTTRPLRDYILPRLDVPEGAYADLAERSKVGHRREVGGRVEAGGRAAVNGEIEGDEKRTLVQGARGNGPAHAQRAAVDGLGGQHHTIAQTARLRLRENGAALAALSFGVEKGAIARAGTPAASFAATAPLTPLAVSAHSRLARFPPT